MFIQNRDSQLYTVEFGSGPRTILAHGGWIGSWELWTEPFAHLSKTWRTVAYDHRGSGVTTAPVESITMENMVSDIFAVMDELGIEKCVLAGESAGGMVVTNAVLQQPHRFEGLILVDATLHNETGKNDNFIRGLKANYEMTCAGFVDACVPESEPSFSEIRNWGKKILARAASDSAIRLLEYSHGVDLRPSLANIKIPTLIFHGTQDVIVPLNESEYAASQIPNSKLHLFQGAGHVPTMTRPRELVDEVNAFFES
ncbi:MAG: alpha/beta hydrolase [Anaerolineales bacterium]